LEIFLENLGLKIPHLGEHEKVTAFCWKITIAAAAAADDDDDVAYWCVTVKTLVLRSRGRAFHCQLSRYHVVSTWIGD